MKLPILRAKTVLRLYVEADQQARRHGETPTEAALRKFKAALAERQADPPANSGIHKVLWDAEREAIASEVIVLEAQAAREARARAFKLRWAEFKALWTPGVLATAVILGLLVVWVLYMMAVFAVTIWK